MPADEIMSDEAFAYHLGRCEFDEASSLAIEAHDRALRAALLQAEALLSETLDWLELPGHAVEEAGLAKRIRAALGEGGA